MILAIVGTLFGNVVLGKQARRAAYIDQRANILTYSYGWAPDKAHNEASDAWDRGAR